MRPHSTSQSFLECYLQHLTVSVPARCEPIYPMTYFIMKYHAAELANSILQRYKTVAFSCCYVDDVYICVPLSTK